MSAVDQDALLADFVAQQSQFAQLPHDAQVRFHSAAKYKAAVLQFSLLNQLRFRGSLVAKFYVADATQNFDDTEQSYYVELVKTSQQHLLLYPHHLADVLMRPPLRMSEFVYYYQIIHEHMRLNKSFDLIPNFTAVDCVRVIGVGRNEYIDAVNNSKERRLGLLKKFSLKQLLPSEPLPIPMQHWWQVRTAVALEDELKGLDAFERTVLERVVKRQQLDAKNALLCGELDASILTALYKRQLIWLDVPVRPSDVVSIPPLQDFVMNRTQGDRFERLLYTVFVSCDETTTVSALADLLGSSLDETINAISLCVRLGLARKRTTDLDRPHEVAGSGVVPDWHVTWRDKIAENKAVVTGSFAADDAGEASQRVGFVVDATLTAFLMMGNLPGDLKAHAVTLFEVGKLADASLGPFMAELQKVERAPESDVQRYNDAAICLGRCLAFLRSQQGAIAGTAGLDLVRVESLAQLDHSTRLRVVKRNYSLLVCAASLASQIAIDSVPLFGPPRPEFVSPWSAIFVRSLVGATPTPPILMLPRGARLTCLPRVLAVHTQIFMRQFPGATFASLLEDTSAVSLGQVSSSAGAVSSEPVALNTSTALAAINDVLLGSAITIEPCAVARRRIALPLIDDVTPADDLRLLAALRGAFGLDKTCGFVELIKTTPDDVWRVSDVQLGLPLDDVPLLDLICAQSAALFAPDTVAAHEATQKQLCGQLIAFIEHFAGPADDPFVPRALLPAAAWLIDERGQKRLFNGAEDE